MLVKRKNAFVIITKQNEGYKSTLVQFFFRIYSYLLDALEMSINRHKNVLLVGASGDVGRSLLPDLVADVNFQVSALSRVDSSAKFPSGINLIKIDYSDQSALVEALTGQDIVISAIGGEGVLKNFDKTLIEVALAAGVKWFIPSEFGFNL